MADRAQVMPYDLPESARQKEGQVDPADIGVGRLIMGNAGATMKTEWAYVPCMRTDTI